MTSVQNSKIDHDIIIIEKQLTSKFYGGRVMRKMFRNFVIIALVFMMGGNVAFAAESPASYYSKKGNDGYYFDAERYATDYPDVANAVGLEKQALWNHYVTFGAQEGRVAWTTNPHINAQIKILVVAASIIDDQMTDRQKVQAVHDWIINNTRYDNANYLAGTLPKQSFEIDGVMNSGYAVCSGYAKTFDAFMDLLGIPCDYVTGYAHGGRHAWNRVFIDGQYLYVDTTWDDPVSWDGRDILCYDYFLIPYSQMSLDHRELKIE